MNLIYKITNLHNNKVYIGQTVQTLGKRRSEHKSRFRLGKRDHKLYLAFKKYGWDSFTWEWICSAVSTKHLNALEQHFIKEHDSYNNGYNMTVGGDTVSKEARIKISKALKGRVVHWAHKTRETRLANGGYVPSKIKGYKIQSPDGVIMTGYNIAHFCKEHGLDQSNLNKTKSGNKSHKGYILLETFNDYPAREYT